MLIVLTQACTTPPSEPTVLIEPAEPTTSDDLIGTISEIDADVSHNISWLRDGFEVEELAGATLVSSALTAKGETWTLQVASLDDAAGPGFSTWGSTITHTVTVVNSPPELLLTLPATRSDEDLVAEIVADDADDEAVVFDISWTLNGQASIFTTQTIPAPELNRGDAWTITVIPHDGEEAGPAVEATVIIDNALPQVINAEWVDSDPAVEGSTLEIELEMDDPDGDALSYEVTWLVNGSAVTGTDPEQLTLTGLFFDRGDEVSALVTPFDDIEGGEPFALDTRTIENTLPVATLVDIDGAAEDEPLICVVEGQDADSDALDWTISWRRDGSAVSGATTTTVPGDTISASKTAVGQEWTCTGTPADDVGDGVSMTSDSVTIREVLSVDGAVVSLSAGTYEYARVELINGATLRIRGLVEIHADEFTVDSSSEIDGVGNGQGAQSGSGAGTAGSYAGGGGGGYGGRGGHGGWDGSSSEVRGKGGATYGSEDGFELSVGSGGGIVSLGGAGGAALWIEAETIDVAGRINVSGEPGTLGSGGIAGGGGSGGGILLYGDVLDLSGAIVANGGDGGDGAASYNDGGGAGGGGRIKLFYGTSLSVTGSTTVKGGIGGDYGTSDWGEDGEVGTDYDEILSWN